MRICAIYDDDYPWDIRVEKILRSLSENDHKVFLAARNKNRAATREITNGIHIHRLNPWKWLPIKLDAILMFPAFFSPRWIAHIKKVVKKNKCDAILVRDLPLSLTGLAIGKILKIPVILDWAENYPAALEAFQKESSHSVINFLIRNPKVASIIEKICLIFADHIYVVAKENKQRLIKYGGRQATISIVMNTPDLRFFTVKKDAKSINEHYKHYFNILYIGEIHPYRGINTIIQSLQEIRNEIKNVKFIIIGKGSGISDIKSIAKYYQVGDIVDILGFKTHSELPNYISLSDVCIIPHFRNKHIDTTLPNKLFDYMAIGKPVIVTDAIPLKRIVEKEKCGLTFQSGNPKSFIEKIAILKDKKIRKEMGQKGLQAVKREYNWSVDSKVLLDVFEIIRKN